MSLTDLYQRVLMSGVDALAEISDPYSKAMAAAALATAMNSSSSNFEEETAEPAVPAKRTRKSKEEKQADATVVCAETEVAAETPQESTEETVDPVVADTAANEQEQSSGFDEESSKKYEVQLALINAAIEEHGIENMETWISSFSDGVLTSINDINPQNIDAFYTFLTQP